MSSIRRQITMSVKAKLARIREGGPPKVLDLFSGCGGISLGFEKAGCLIVGGVERDADAAASFRWNFRDKRRSPPAIWLSELNHDITRTQPSMLARNAGVAVREAVDILVGGPPCQAFARIGRAKLRSVTADPEAWLNDPRADLYKSYLRYVRDFAPCALFMENVPDFLAHGSDNVADEVCSNLVALGYRPHYTLMNASFYGVPQHRERMILVALHASVDALWTFPRPSHRADPPAGYKGTRSSALARKGGDSEVEEEHAFFLQPPDEVPGATTGRPAAPAVVDAINDLPRIEIRSIGPRFSRELRFWSYRLGRSSVYASMMRRWAGHAGGNRITDHLTRYLPRDFSIFKDMNPGEQYPEMHRRQVRRRDKAALHAGIRPGTAGWRKLTAKLVPPYPPDKFPNKWYRLVGSEPSRTLLAHLGKDGYTHIHPIEPRVISVREAARLQSFPDGFLFKGPMNSMFRQIGNSVPPLMAFAVARHLIRCLMR